MIPINDIFDFLILAGLLTLAVLAAVARRRIFRSNERVKISPSDWLVLSDSSPSLGGVTPRRYQPPLSQHLRAAEAIFGTSCASRAGSTADESSTKVTKHK